MALHTKEEHRARAQKYLAMAWQKDSSGGSHYPHDIRSEIIAAAHVHAVLALSAEYVINEDEY